MTITQGYFSHLCYCNGKYYSKHIIYVNKGNTAIEIVPFTHETPHTIFCDGILLAVSENFETEKETFISSLHQYLTTHPHDTIVDAINKSEIVDRHHIAPLSDYNLYTLTPIEWQSKRPTEITALRIERIDI